MILNNIKIGVVAVLSAATTFTATVQTNELEVKQEVRVPKVTKQSVPPCMQMYNYIKQYADTFDVPLRFAFGVARIETGYQGPFHWNYNHAQGSSAGALGPMQIMLPTARSNNHDNVSRERLRNDIEYNVRTSMKVLRKLYNKYGNWKVVFGCYNTGRPCINGYAERVYNHKINW
jgi:soluble lytic murein transglycosylase-like protein